VTRGRWALVALWALLVAGCTPVYTWDINTNSTTRPPSFNVGELSRQPVVTVGLVAAGGLAGYSTALSHALVAALAEASPPIRAVPSHEIANAVNDRGLASEYAELLAGFARNGIMERERLQRIGSALGSRYLLLPGLAQFDHAILDRFEITGIKVIRTRVTILRVWLQLWDMQTGHILITLDHPGWAVVAPENLPRLPSLVGIVQREQIPERLMHVQAERVINVRHKGPHV